MFDLEAALRAGALREAREALGVTRRVCAERLGIPFNSYNHYESGRVPAKVTNARVRPALVAFIRRHSPSYREVAHASRGGL